VRTIFPKKSVRAAKLLPARLQPMVSLLEDALGEVHLGELDPRAASAMASLAGALVRVTPAGELEERLRALDAMLGSCEQRIVVELVHESST